VAIKFLKTGGKKNCIETEHPLYRKRTNSYKFQSQVIVNHTNQKLAYSSHWKQQKSHV